MGSNKLWDLLSGAAALIGLVGFLGGAVVAIAGSRVPLRGVEFPLGDVQDIAIDADGNVALALGFYGRIQVYDAIGRFRGSWSADALGGAFTVSFRSSDRVASYANRRGSTVLFTASGERIAEESTATPPGSKESLGVTTAHGATITVKRRLFWPTVLIEKGGTTSTLLSEPWYLRPIEGPIATWLLMVLGGVLNRSTLSRIKARLRAG